MSKLITRRGLLRAAAIAAPTILLPRAEAQFGACLPGFCSSGSACSQYTIPSTSDLVMWLDTCVFSSLDLSGAAIENATDQSSNGYIFASGAVPPSYLAAGFNGRPTMLFSGTTTLQSLNSTVPIAFGTGNELTIFAAATLGTDTDGFHNNGRLMSYTGSGEAHDTDNVGSFALLNPAATSHMAFYRNSLVTPDVDVVRNVNRRIIFTLASDGTKTLYLDNSPTAVAGAVANFVSDGFLSIGASQHDSGFFSGNYVGLISEIGLYNVFKDSTAVGALDTYLKNKWGM